MPRKKVSHTEGPWKVEPYKSYDKWIHINDDLIRVNNDDMPPGEGEANAKLIAKLPDMVIELKKLKEENEQLTTNLNNILDEGRKSFEANQQLKDDKRKYEEALELIVKTFHEENMASIAENILREVRGTTYLHQNKTGYSSPENIGSSHWLRTLLFNIGSIGHFMVNNKQTGIKPELLEAYGERLVDTVSDIIAYEENKGK